MAFIARNPVTNHLEFSDAADLSTGQYVASAQWIGETAHITAQSPTFPNTFWVCVLQNSTTHQWLQLATAGATLLPDQRFTVGTPDYNLLDPGVATFTSVAFGITAANAGVGLVPPSGASAAAQRLVEIQPQTYAEVSPLSLVPYVHLHGMGNGPEATVIAGPALTVQYTGGAGYLVVRDINFSDVDFSILPTGNVTIVFENCSFTNGTTWALTTPGTGVLVVVRFINCSGQFATSSDTIAATDNLYKEFNGAMSEADGVTKTLSFAALPTYAGAGNLNLLITGGQRLQTNGTEMSRFQGTVVADVITEECLLSTQNTGVSVWSVTTTSLTGVSWQARSGTRLDATPASYFNAGAGATAIFRGGQVEILGHTVTTGSPLNPIGAGSVTSQNYPSNRQRWTQNLTLVVPASDGAGGGPYASAAAAVAAMEFPQPVDAFADEFRLVADYTALGADPLDPDTANFATTFRYASFRLPNPLFLEEGREYVFKNAGDPSSATDGPVALRLPNGSTTTVDYMFSEISVRPVFVSTDYIILGNGDAVRISVDRSGVQARYVITT